MSDDWNDTPGPSDDGFMGGESFPALKFGAVGDTHEGIVRNVKRKQDHDLDTNTPMTWPNGDPKWVWLFELEDATGEMGTLWVRGNLVKVIREAVKAAGAGSPVGWHLKVQHHELGEKKKAGLNAPKLYRAKLTPAPVRAAATSGGSGGSRIPDEEPFLRDATVSDL